MAMAPHHYQNVRMTVSVRPRRPPDVRSAPCEPPGALPPRHGIATTQARLPERSMTQCDHQAESEQHLHRAAYTLRRAAGGGTPCDHSGRASLGKCAGHMPARVNSNASSRPAVASRGIVCPGTRPPRPTARPAMTAHGGRRIGSGGKWNSNRGSHEESPPRRSAMTVASIDRRAGPCPAATCFACDGVLEIQLHDKRGFHRGCQ